jgi:hypothetical protein
MRQQNKRAHKAPAPHHVQSMLWQLINGAWEAMPVQEAGKGYMSNPEKPKSRKSNRVIDWSSSLNLQSYDHWLKANYAICERYAVSKAMKYLKAYMDECDCQQAGMDGCVEGIIKVRSVLQEGPIASGSFIQYTKTAISRVILDMNRRDHALRNKKSQAYRSEIADEYESGTEIDLEPQQDHDLQTIILDWLKANYRQSIDDVILWRHHYSFSCEYVEKFNQQAKQMGLSIEEATKIAQDLSDSLSAGSKQEFGEGEMILYRNYKGASKSSKHSSKFTEKAKLMGISKDIAIGKAERVMAFLQHHIKGLTPQEAAEKLLTWKS